MTRGAIGFDVGFVPGQGHARDHRIRSRALRTAARVPYTLLEAADSLGLIVNTPVATRWRELDRRLRAGGR